MGYKLVNRRVRCEGDDGPERQEKVLEFDLLPPWPKKYFGQSFGPSLIHRAMEASFYVLARIPETPLEVRVYETRWSDGALQVADTYAILIQKGHKDFAAINEAILKRWSMSGLQWIKTQAWKQLEQR